MKRNIGIIGCGYWGKNLIRNFYDLEALHTICDSDEDVTCFFNGKYPDIRVANNYFDLLEDPAIEAVAIATPAVTHYPIGKDALSAGKDVFVEKPISLKREQGEELASLADEGKRILMVGHILEYHPAIVKLKEIIHNDELGRLQYVYSNRLNLGKFRTEENILWSFAPHDISVITGLLDAMPTEVAAHGGNYLNPDIADVTVTSMTFPDHVKAHLFVSWLHPYKEQKLVIIGDKQMVLFDDVNPTDKLFLYRHKIDWSNGAPVPIREEADPVPISDEEPLKAECRHFLECIDTRKTPRTDAQNGLKVLRILEACQESLHAQGKPVCLEE